MIKIRLSGYPEEIDRAIEILLQSFKLSNVSGKYQNRNSDYYRQYLDCEFK